MRRINSGESVGEAARDGDRRVGKRSRRGEPIGGGDVEADRERYGFGARADQPEDGSDQPEGGDKLADPLADTGAVMG